jgi:hypothetical protein
MNFDLKFVMAMFETMYDMVVFLNIFFEISKKQSYSNGTLEFHLI